MPRDGPLTLGGPPGFPPRVPRLPERPRGTRAAPFRLEAEALRAEAPRGGLKPLDDGYRVRLQG